MGETVSVGLLVSAMTEEKVTVMVVYDVAG